MKKRTIALLTAAVMLFGVVVGGTVAWLTVKSDPVQNTFTVGDINIKLDEVDVNIENDDKTITYEEFVKDNIGGAEYEEATRVDKNTYELIPGASYFKDPKVKVLKGSEPCYVYVKVTETNNDDDTIVYSVDNTKWVLVEGYSDLYRYHTTLDAATEDKVTESVILNSNIKISTELTKDEMHPKTGTYAKPQLDFIAAAVQSENIITIDVADEEAAKLLGATPTVTP